MMEDAAISTSWEEEAAGIRPNMIGGLYLDGHVSDLVLSVRAVLLSEFQLFQCGWRS